MQTKTKTNSPAPKPDAQPVQAAFSHEDYHSARIAGSYVAAAEIAEALAIDPDLHPSIRAGYIAEAARMRAKDALLAALEAIHEAGRMSSQPRAVYCALIAEDALIAAGNRTAIESRWNKGEALFAVHEMDEEPTPITSLDMLNAYSPDQVYAAAPALLAALEQCLPFVDRIRASSGGDGNLTAQNARAAIAAAKG